MPVSGVSTSKIRSQESKSVVIWEAKSSSVLERCCKDYRLLDYKLMSWESIWSLLLGLMHLVLHLSKLILTLWISLLFLDALNLKTPLNC